MKSLLEKSNYYYYYYEVIWDLLLSKGTGCRYRYRTDIGNLTQKSPGSTTTTTKIFMVILSVVVFVAVVVGLDISILVLGMHPISPKM